MPLSVSLPDIPIRLAHTHTQTHTYADLRHTSPATPYTPFAPNHDTTHETWACSVGCRWSASKLKMEKKMKWKWFVVYVSVLERSFSACLPSIDAGLGEASHTASSPSLYFFDLTYLLFLFNFTPTFSSFELFIFTLSISLSICAAQ